MALVCLDDGIDEVLQLVSNTKPFSGCGLTKHLTVVPIITEAMLPREMSDLATAPWIAFFMPVVTSGVVDDLNVLRMPRLGSDDSPGSGD